jgi:hypothetical protein
MVCFRYIIVNTVHKRDDKDNNNNNNNNNNKATVIPVTIGATGNISKSFTKYLSNVPGKHEIKELQKTATLSIANIYCVKC